MPAALQPVNAPTDQDVAFTHAIALELIGHGSYGEKLRYIARNAPDWFIDEILFWDGTYTVESEDGSPMRRALIETTELDSTIARLALGNVQYESEQSKAATENIKWFMSRTEPTPSNPGQLP